ncbi:MAG: hypothetical protein ACUVRJ_03335 [Candidatus Villigracilaceae bacterium]
MTIFNSISVTTLIILLIAGTAIGLLAANTDLLNPVTSQAEAERTQAETRHLDMMNRLEEELSAAKTQAEIARIQHQQELEEARHQAELARIAADQNYYQQMQTIKLSARQGFVNVMLVLSGAGGIALIFIGTRFILVNIKATLPVSRPTPIAAQPNARRSAAAQSRRRSPNGYEPIRIQARQRELLERAIYLRLKNAADNGISNMTDEQYNRLPLAQ